jgi:hypothetical protein
MVCLAGALPGLTWTITYERSGPGLVTKQLWIESAQEAVLARVAPAAFASDAAPEVVSTGLQDIAAFLYNGDRGVFASLNFPWSRITTENGLTRISYPPYEALHAGTRYTCHSLTLGGFRRSGETRYGRDTGAVAAMDAYVQGRYPQRFERPMFVSACINNRYTMPREGMVWYTYKDHPTLSFNVDLMRRELDLMPRLGMEYYQVFPGVFDWAPNDPDRAVVSDIVRYANARGVRVGDYSGTSSVFCPHYNEYNNTLNRPEWLMRDAQGNPGGFCFGDKAFVDYYIDTVVSAAKQHGFELHCLDFLGIAPCFAKDHGHPVGDESVYHQVRGLVRMMDAVAAVDPDTMVWSNSGNWSEFLPKIAWSNPNLYLTDPFIATPWPGLNMTRLLDDARREQMVSLHYKTFVPYRCFTNCQYFFSQNSIVPDVRNYQYGALSSLAVTPNLCLAEVRPWLDRLPAPQQEEAIAFYKKWTDLLKQNFELWKTTHHVGDDPQPGGVEIYAHTDVNRGFVFVVNPNYASATVEVPLDARLGFTGEGACELRQLYPREGYALTPQGPTPAFGSVLTLDAPAQQVCVYEVTPAREPLDRPCVYGLFGTSGEDAEGFFVAARGPQGTTQRFAVRVPEGRAPLNAATVRPDEPKQAKRLYAETPLRALGQSGSYALYELTFRRMPAPTELRSWHAVPGDLASGDAAKRAAGFSDGEACTFPLETSYAGPLSNFLGAYIDNAFSEDQDVSIDFRARGETLPDVPIASVLKPQPASAAPAQGDAREWWLRTEFNLPFMYTIGAEPAFDEHTVLVLPMRDASRVRELRAWVNGVPLEVRRYAYPRNRALSTYWADLVGTAAHGGDNVLVVYAAFEPEKQ